MSLSENEKQQDFDFDKMKGTITSWSSLQDFLPDNTPKDLKLFLENYFYTQTFPGKKKMTSWRENLAAFPQDPDYIRLIQYNKQLLMAIGIAVRGETEIVDEPGLIKPAFVFNEEPKKVED